MVKNNPGEPYSRISSEEALEDYKEKIISGEIVPPSARP